MEQYQCEICGKKHEVYGGIKSPLPDLIMDIPEEERADRVSEFEGLYVVDRKWLLGSGHISIEMKGLDEPIFGWQVWVSIPPSDFQDNIPKLSNQEIVEIDGRLQSTLPFYRKSKGLNVRLRLRAVEELLIEVKIVEESELKQDQAQPISRARVIEIMQGLHHQELWRGQPVFDQPFSERLQKALLKLEKKYLAKQAEFVLNVSTPSAVLFQIVSSKMLKTITDREAGFALHLSFDESFAESLVELDKFKQQDYCQDFTYHNLDDIPTFQLDLGLDKNRIIELTNRILTEVYEQVVEKIELDILEL